MRLSRAAILLTSYRDFRQIAWDVGSIDSDDGLALNKGQAFTWSKDDQDLFSEMLSLCLNVLTRWSRVVDLYMRQ